MSYANPPIVIKGGSVTVESMEELGHTTPNPGQKSVYTSTKRITNIKVFVNGKTIPLLDLDVDPTKWKIHLTE